MHKGTVNQITSVVRTELKRQTTMKTMSVNAIGSGLASAVRASRESSYSPPHSSE
jgi:hypothetical protein